MNEFVLDFGNLLVKWYAPKKDDRGDFLHAMVRISDAEWGRIVGNDGTPQEGAIKVNGIPYIVGNTARRHQLKSKPKGAARYTEGYYGVALCYALSEHFQDSKGNIKLFASHAPGDVDYRGDIRRAALGKWIVESEHGVLTFEVEEVDTFDEPLGGLWNYVLRKDGNALAKNPLKGKDTLVIDVGGHTVDVVVVGRGGKILPKSLDSTRTGVLNLLDTFEHDLRSNNPRLFQQSGDLDILRVEDAVISGEYAFGKIKVDCRSEARAATNVLVNSVIDTMNAVGSAANFDIVLLTGGGAALIYDTLEEFVGDRIQLAMSEPRRELMKYANVFGGAKMLALQRRVR